MIALPPLASRLTALALAAALPLLVGTQLLWPAWQAWEESGRRAEDLASEVAGLRLRLAESGSDDRIPSVRSGPQPWRGASKPLVAARVQEAVQAIAAKAGLSLASVTYVETPAAAEVATIELRLELAGGFESMAGFLHGIESHEPILLIATASLTPRAGSGPGPGAPVMDRIEARLELAAPVALAAEP